MKFLCVLLLCIAVVYAQNYAETPNRRRQSSSIAQSSVTYRRQRNLVYDLKTRSQTAENKTLDQIAELRKSATVKINEIRKLEKQFKILKNDLIEVNQTFVIAKQELIQELQQNKDIVDNRIASRDTPANQKIGLREESDRLEKRIQEMRDLIFLPFDIRSLGDGYGRHLK
ncbi:uncharacterized protein LOC128963974 [Oppia nitens]|uniref:uncharacterized protein LOC128963974 n=1 Tax=Oppia nitens TaxID=1686743 RepID=UPI0023D9C7CC|nr:uncharacterized protein LOC128963974 [Oppia nitens]